MRPLKSPAIDVDDLQGLVARSYASLDYAAYVPVTFSAASRARAWTGEMADTVTSAVWSTKGVKELGRARNVAFTREGLAALGLVETRATGFSREFEEGMASEHRTRLLGDTGPADPETWRWGGPRNPPLHAMLFLFGGTPERLADVLAEEAARAEAHSATLGDPLPTVALPERKEHFGFDDGIEQPNIAGLRGAETTAPTEVLTIPAGEVILGYPNAYGHLPASPTVPASEPAERLLKEAARDSPGEHVRYDLGRNGTYVVFRQLAQDVRAFWRFADERTGSDPAARKWLAAKMVGRWPNGAPLVDHAEREPPEFTKENDFCYENDLQGERCPLGAHVRRANPRDGMGPDPKSSILVANRHRLLRRGRAYGEPLPGLHPFDPAAILGAPADGHERGLHFVCFNSDISRQFEFVQNTWVNNMKFNGLYADPDPVIAPHVDPATAKAPEEISVFTMQRVPVRRVERGLPRFVTMRGGAYLFMPGVSALRYLSAFQ